MPVPSPLVVAGQFGQIHAKPMGASRLSGFGAIQNEVLKMHGEYKVPGGKLVVADLENVDGKITNVLISGDFFLEPDEALAGIIAAIEGLHETTTVQEMAQAIRQSLPEDALLFGFSAEAVAIAVRRALGVAKTWRDFEWQIIDANQAHQNGVIV